MSDSKPFHYPVAPLVRACSGQIDGLLEARVLVGIESDSRTLSSGALFVALRGERFDGHDFIERAEAVGAAAALVDRETRASLRARGVALPLICVEDTLIAFGEIARAHRETMPARVVGVGGSNGKTTTKEMVAAILSKAGETLRTAANHNNRVGVPQTLLSLRPEHRFAAIEMGTNEPGEMALLTRYAKPDVGLLTNIQAEHLEGLGSLAGVLEEETRLYAGMPSEGTCVVPADEPLLKEHPSLMGRRHRTFGHSEGASIRVRSTRSLGLTGQHVELEVDGEVHALTLPLLGAHNASNAAAATACARALGIGMDAVIAGLEGVSPVKQRMVPMQIMGRWVINDAYNANPGSMRAALEALPTLLPGVPWVAVLGEMREMGAHAPALHAALGELAVRAPLKALYVFGAGAAETAAAARRIAPELPLCQGDSPEEAAAFVAHHSAPGEGVLIKGSRGVRLERVIERLAESFRGEPERTRASA